MVERDNRNVFGQKGCSLPDGSLCSGPCCIKYQVTLGDLNEGPFKPAFSPCPHQVSGEGCSLHNLGIKPYRCGEYHCSVEMPHDKISLIGGAYVVGEISRDEALDAAKLWINKPETELLAMIEKAADEFRGKVEARELEYIEFDQP
jgi:hypothetical protein